MTLFAQDIAVETGLSESKAIACLQVVSNLHRTEIATGAFTPLLLLEQTRCKFTVPCTRRKQVIRRVVAGLEALNSRFSYRGHCFLPVLYSPLRNSVLSRPSSSGVYTSWRLDYASRNPVCEHALPRVRSCAAGTRKDTQISIFHSDLTRLYRRAVDILMNMYVET